jgi:hypothetical protein
MPRARALTLQVLREVILVVSAYFFYNIAKNLIHPDPSTEGFKNAWNVMTLEQSLGIFHEQSLQAWLMKDANGVAPHLITMCHGPRVTQELATELGFDAGFAPGTLPSQVAGYVTTEMIKRLG